MSAETGVYKVVSEVSLLGGKCGLDACSTHDLPKPNCNGMGNEDLATDPDNSNVFVTGADDKSEDALEIKVVAAVDLSNVLELKSSVEDFGVKLDVEQAYESLMDAKNGTVEVSDRNPLVVNVISAKNEISPVGRVRVLDTIEENSLEDKRCAYLDAQNGNLDVEEVYESLVDGKNGTVEVNDGNPLVVNVISVEKEISPVGGVRVLDTLEENSLEDKCCADSDAQNGNLDVDNREDNEFLKEGEKGNVERNYGKPFMVNDNTLKRESFSRAGDGIQDKIEEQFKKSECETDAEIAQIADNKGNIESSEVVVAEKANNQNEKTESMADTEWKKVEDLSVSESSACLEENQGSEAPNLGLVAESAKEGYLNKLLSPMNESVQTKDAREHEIILGSIILGSTETSQFSFEDAGDCQLQEVCKEENEIKFTSKVVKTVEGEVAQATSFNPGSECCSIDNKKETTEAEAQSALSTGGYDRKWDIVPGNRVQCSLGTDKREVITADCHFGTVCDQFSKEESKECSVSHVEENVQYPEHNGELSCFNILSHENMSSEIETEGPVLSQSISAPSGVVHESLTDGAEAHTVENGPFDFNSQEVYTVNDISSGCDPTLETVVCIEKEQTMNAGNAYSETEVSSWKSEDEHSPHTCTDVELKPECHDSCALDDIDLTSDVRVTSGILVLDNFVVDKEVANIILESAEVKNEGEQLSGVMGSKDETLLFHGNEDIGKFQNENISKASSEGSSTDAITGDDASVDAVAKPFNFLVRIPRFNDDKLREQIKYAKLEVTEKTKLRDAIQAKILEKRVNNQIHGIDYERAKGESRSLRKLVALKRTEIGSLQSVINKAKNAISIEDMDGRINNIERMIQHETLPLKEEKELIREIKQLKQLREQLSCNMGSQSEIQQALEQREEAEERLKILRKELAILKDRMSKAQTAIMEAESKYDDENKKIKELQAQFRAADDIRQAAYVKWQALRKLLSQKNKYFVEYKDDEAAANNCAFSGDREALYHLCMNQVGKFMELWNRNGEFRSEYVRFNARSTVRRLGTLDGCSLGPDEKPPILPSYGNKERNDKLVLIPANVDSISRSQSVELNQQTSLENVASDIQSIKTMMVSKNQTMRTKGPTELKFGNTSATFSGGDVTHEMQEEDSVNMIEEVELTRKEEETGREEAEAKKKEELRLEQLAKAKEAREKKKRHDEKVQMREELKARKEAELKEKEKEKKLRKRERKKAASDSTDVNDSSEAGESTMDIVKEDIQVSDNSSCAATNRPKKTFTASKQNKTKTLPPPLRNRNRKKWQHWMWVSLTSLVVILVFWLGNMGLFANVNLKRHSPAY